ncbi:MULTISPECIES: long-chain-fatty-acid--CoA ligase [Sphingobium]|uniref:long-chain-fatty-acid--CoA ligase n=1 Tax=Sphingobium TaxID=165695 RepID=UPI0015EB442D|nr:MULTISPECIES: long-chain fatty acid--CoA ligase [Sphingobium]MCW2364303.1 long-chain acyl-CoA synthetase [Sphingobium sp. B10D3B]MCW2402300.1 long-chain acyl-CoA synthetase [Sphingobium sp. B10D7B]MCW2409279.1 long-chain acyl-CoA synthetase [Sphingobium xanthum]
MESEKPAWQDHYDHPVAWAQDFAPLSLPEMLRSAVEQDGSRPMLDFYGRKFSYAECYRNARRFAAGLIGLGVQPGDRVGLYLPNVPHYVVAYYGAMMAGAIAVNFSPLYTVEELAHQAEDSGTTLLVTISAKPLFGNACAVLDCSCIDRLVVGSVVGGLPLGKSLLYRLFKRSADDHVPSDPRILSFGSLLGDDPSSLPSIDPLRDLALLQYTGGTTGRPKGAMLTHQNLSANARQIDLLDPWHALEDRILGALPFFHVFANTAVLNRTVVRGGEIVILPRFDARQVIAAIQRTRVTSLPGVPTMFQALLDSPYLAKADLSSLRVCISGGAPLPLPLKERFMATTGARLVEGYGLTESSGVVSANPYDGPGKTGSIGQPIPGTRVRLLDREDPSRLAQPGEPGEIAFDGPQRMQGYWQNPDADREVFVDGFLRTGDVGTIDQDGYFRVVDRIKDMIAVGGFKVFPSQVEDVLYRHPAVREALVIGIPDDYRGEVPKAFVTLRPEVEDDIDGERLKDWLNPQLGKHERVCAVEIRESLPRTLVGKLSRKELVAEERAKVGLV